jgi:hypothetical protein
MFKETDKKISRLEAVSEKASKEIGVSKRGNVSYFKKGFIRLWFKSIKSINGMLKNLGKSF